MCVYLEMLNERQPDSKTKSKTIHTLTICIFRNFSRYAVTWMGVTYNINQQILVLC